MSKLSKLIALCGYLDSLGYAPTNVCEIGRSKDRFYLVIDGVEHPKLIYSQAINRLITFAESKNLTIEE